MENTPKVKKYQHRKRAEKIENSIRKKTLHSKIGTGLRAEMYEVNIRYARLKNPYLLLKLFLADIFDVAPTRVARPRDA